VVVAGRLAVEPYTITKDDGSGEVVTEHRTSLAIENATIAIDLSRGAARYYRTERDLPEPSDAPNRARNRPAQPDVAAITADNWAQTGLDALEAELIAA